MLAPVPPVHAGSFLVLNCTIQLSSAVDSEVVVTTTWRKNGMVVDDSPQRTVSDTTQINSSALYRAQLAFNPLQLNTDDGLYMCEVTVESNAEFGFVVSSQSRSNNTSLRAIGIFNQTINPAVISHSPIIHTYVLTLMHTQFPHLQQKCNHQL